MEEEDAEIVVAQVDDEVEFWRQSTRETYRGAALTLLRLGMERSDVVTFLVEMYESTAEEFVFAST